MSQYDSILKYDMAKAVWKITYLGILPTTLYIMTLHSFPK